MGTGDLFPVTLSCTADGCSYSYPTPDATDPTPYGSLPVDGTGVHGTFTWSLAADNPECPGTGRLTADLDAAGTTTIRGVDVPAALSGTIELLQDPDSCAAFRDVITVDGEAREYPG